MSFKQLLPGVSYRLFCSIVICLLSIVASYSQSLCETVVKTKNVIVNLGPSGIADVNPLDVYNGSISTCGTPSSFALNKTVFSCADKLISGYRYAFSAVSTTGNDNYPSEIGLKFIVKQPIVISQLGAFDHLADGIRKDIAVSVFKIGETVPVTGLSATITGFGSQRIGNYIMQNLPAPVELLPGAYILVSKGFNEHDLFGNTLKPGFPPAYPDKFDNRLSYQGAVMSTAHKLEHEQQQPVNAIVNPALQNGTSTDAYFHSATFRFFEGGANEVVLTATDINGHTSAQKAVVYVVDSAAPVLKIRNVLATLDASGKVVVDARDFDNGSYDNCGGPITFNVNKNEFECGSANITSGHRFAFTSSTTIGNHTSGEAIGTIFNVKEPIVISQLGAFDDNDDGLNNNIRVAVFRVGESIPLPGLDVVITGRGTDRLPGYAMQRLAAPVELMPGAYILVAKGFNEFDKFGLNNVISYPAAKPDHYNYRISYGQTYLAQHTDFINPALQNTGSASLYAHAATFRFFVGGANTVRVTVRDNKGNNASVSTNVYIVDATAPIISNCPKDIVVSTDGSEMLCSKIVDWIPPVITDNCQSPITIEVSHAPGFAFSVGTTTVRYTARDVSGNQSSCVFNVTVHDKTAPVITCAEKVTQCFGINENKVQLKAKAIDNCTAADQVVLWGNRSDGNAIDAPYPVGITTVTWHAKDAAGNVAISTTIVTIVAAPAFEIASVNNLGTMLPAGVSYFGYEPASSVKLSVKPDRQTAIGAIKWSTGGTALDEWVTPDGSTTTVNYAVTIVDNNGCENKKEIGIQVIDIRCGNKEDKVVMCNKPGKNNPETCVKVKDVEKYIQKGYLLGYCPITPAADKRTAKKTALITAASSVRIFPNPSHGQFVVKLQNFAVERAEVLLISPLGFVLEKRYVQLSDGSRSLNFDVKLRINGIYILKVITATGMQTHKVLVHKD